ncbi:MAG: hypothetical protein WBD20_16225 [Pirellulaceae bacterium]
MSKTISRSALQKRADKRPTTSVVSPSRVSADAKPFTLDQELEPFGNWVADPLWVPPKDSSVAMAESMLKQSGYFKSKAKRWAEVVNEHRDNFTQVREIDLCKASIRLPKGRFLVSVTEKKDFDKITDAIPNCVQTRLDEFLAGPGKRHGVKVYYLKPLCMEVGDELILTDKDDVLAAIEKIQKEVFAEYRYRYLCRLPLRMAVGTVDLALAIPRTIVNHYVQKRKREIDELHNKLEFKRRKIAHRTARTHRKYRTDGCTYDEILALTNPLERADVIEQFGEQNELSRAQRDQLIRMAAGAMPWFVTLSISAVAIGTAIVTSLTTVAPVAVCDPVFVAEMPGSKGQVLKIGHFDEVAGVTHIEL